MPTKTKIIFIIVFIIVGISMIGGYLYFTRSVVQNADGTKTTTYKSFNPFGSGGKNEVDVPITDDIAINNNPQNQVGLIVASRFKKITETPVSGASFFKTVITPEIIKPVTEENKVDPKNKEVKPETTQKEVVTEPIAEQPKEEIMRTLRYSERITGHMYVNNLDTKTNTRASNTTVPNIYESYFNDTGSMALYRYVASDNKTISTYVVAAGKETGTFLPSSIVSLSMSPKKDKFFYLVKTINGSVGYVKNFTDAKGKVVFESSFSEWISQYINDSTIYLTTKASNNKEGYLYALNINTGALSKLYGGIQGFTTVANKSGSFVLISDTKDGSPKLKLLDVSKHSLSELSVYGLPEKCVWGSDDINLYCAVPNNIQSGQYPDDWYQGVVSFNDRFIKINTSNSEITPLGESDTDSFDAINLFLNDTEDKLFFVNKKDSLLWSLDLK